MEESRAQHETESRRLENLKMLSSPDQVKGIFTEIVTGEGNRDFGNASFDIFPPKHTTKPTNGRGTFTAILNFTTWHSIAIRES